MARACTNVGRDLDIRVIAKASPCPMFSSSEHTVTITNNRNREVEGDTTSVTRHKFAEFDAADRLTKHFVLNQGTHDSMKGKLVQGPQGTGQETIETDFDYEDETEKGWLDYPEKITVDYLIRVL